MHRITRPIKIVTQSVTILRAMGVKLRVAT